MSRVRSILQGHEKRRVSEQLSSPFTAVGSFWGAVEQTTPLLSPETHPRLRLGLAAGEIPSQTFPALLHLGGSQAPHSQQGPQQLPPSWAQQTRIPPGFGEQREAGAQPPGVPAAARSSPKGDARWPSSCRPAKKLFISSKSKSGSGSVCAKLFTWLPGCFPSSGYFSSSVHVYGGLTCCEERRYYLWLIIGIWLAGRVAGIRYRGAYTACSKLRSAPPPECACLRCQLTLFSLPPFHQ